MASDSRWLVRWEEKPFLEGQTFQEGCIVSNLQIGSMRLRVQRFLDERIAFGGELVERFLRGHLTAKGGFQHARG